MFKRLGVGVALSLVLSACGGNKPYVCNDPEAFKVFERLPEETQQVFADAIALHEADAGSEEYENLLSSYENARVGDATSYFAPGLEILVNPAPIDEMLDGSNSVRYIMATAEEGKVDDDGDGYSDFAYQCGVGDIEMWGY